MKESSLLFAAFIAVNAAGCLGPGFSESRYRVEDEETIRKTLEFSSGAGPKVLEVDNVQGSIKVTGDDGRMVEMVANRTNRAESQSILQTAKQEVKLDIKDKADTVQIYVDEPQDDVLQREAQRQGKPKAALIRQALASQYPVVLAVEEDA